MEWEEDRVRREEDGVRRQEERRGWSEMPDVESILSDDNSFPFPFSIHASILIAIPLPISNTISIPLSGIAHLYYFSCRHPPSHLPQLSIFYLSPVANNSHNSISVSYSVLSLPLFLVLLTRPVYWERLATWTWSGAISHPSRKAA